MFSTGTGGTHTQNVRSRRSLIRLGLATEPNGTSGAAEAPVVQLWFSKFPHRGSFFRLPADRFPVYKQPWMCASDEEFIAVIYKHTDELRNSSARILKLPEYLTLNCVPLWRAVEAAPPDEKASVRSSASVPTHTLRPLLHYCHCQSRKVHMSSQLDGRMSTSCTCGTAIALHRSNDGFGGHRQKKPSKRERPPPRAADTSQLWVDEMF